MPHAQLPDEQENAERRTEEIAVVSAPVVALYGSALFQLNLLDAPDGVEKKNAESGDGLPSQTHGDSNELGAAIESFSAGDVPGSQPSAIAELNELCGLAEPTEKIDAASERPHGEAANFNTFAGSTEPSEKDLAQTRLAGPRSFEVIPQKPSESREHQTNFDSSGEEPKIATVSTASDFEALLLDVIDSTVNDPRQLRHLIYELARANLREDVGSECPSVTPEDIGALETAIARIELNLSRRQRSESEISAIASVQENSADRVERSSATRGLRNLPISGLGPYPRWLSRQDRHTGGNGLGLRSAAQKRASVEIVYPEPEKVYSGRAQRRLWLWFIVWPCIQFIGPAIFCVFLYFTLAGRQEVRGIQAPQGSVVDTHSSAAAVPAPRSSGLPLPSSYGIYAVSNGGLSALEPLPIRAPDPRIQVSAEISKPSSTVLPDGKVVFILFQRDLLNSAPRKLAVRVVARVASNLTFSSGKAAAVKPGSSWHIRGNSYTFQVSPLNENREMIVARPEQPDFALPSGRYALVFEGLAYDFTVDGPITDPSQCLESFEAVGGAVFNECRPR